MHKSKTKSNQQSKLQNKCQNEQSKETNKHEHNDPGYNKLKIVWYFNLSINNKIYNKG
jgi:hypothetical protein